MTDQNKATLEKANAAIMQGDHEGFLALCTEDTEWAFLGERTLHGKEEVRRWMKEAYKEPPVFNVERLVAEGDTVVAIGVITIRDENGKAAGYDYSDVWTFREGKMSRLKAFVVNLEG